MRVRLWLILTLLAGLSRPLAAVSAFHNCQLSSRTLLVSTTAKSPLPRFSQALSARHLFSLSTGDQSPSLTFNARTSDVACTPLDLLNNDPLRSKFMYDASPEAPCNGRGHRKDERILKHLRKMSGYCRRKHRRDLCWYYDAGWEFAAEIVYGPLPARHDFSTGQHPETVRTKFPPGAARPPAPWPLKKIVKRFTVPWNNYDYTYETLECYHILSAPVGYSVPAKGRRCIHCAIAAASQSKKKSVASASAVAIAKSKAVGA